MKRGTRSSYADFALGLNVFAWSFCFVFALNALKHDLLINAVILMFFSFSSFVMTLNHFLS